MDIIPFYVGLGGLGAFAIFTIYRNIYPRRGK